MLYVPEIDQNLLSFGQLVEKGFKLLFKNKSCLIKDANDKDILKVKMRGNFFALNPLEEEKIAFPIKENVSVSTSFEIEAPFILFLQIVPNFFGCLEGYNSGKDHL